MIFACLLEREIYEIICWIESCEFVVVNASIAAGNPITAALKFRIRAKFKFN